MRYLAQMAKTTPQYLKDETARLYAIRPLIEKGVIVTWQDIFKYIPRTVIATQFGINNGRMKELVANPSPLTLERLAEIALFLKVDYHVLSALAYEAMPISKVKGKKK